MAKKEVDITKEKVAAKMKSISKGYRYIFLYIDI